MRTPALETAYRATTYCVDLPTGAAVLRIGTASPLLVAALAGRGCSEWAILCAANPGSRMLAEAENASRFARLFRQLTEAGLECWLGVNLADAGDWPPEPSVCVPGLSRDQALAVAAIFGQNAIVVGDAQGVPALAWVE